MLVNRDPNQDIPAAVTEFCRSEGFGEIISAQIVKGGAISLTRRIMTASHISFIVKQSPNPPADLYPIEAKGLNALKNAGMRTPEVYAVAANFILLEDMGSVAIKDSSWEAFGRALAALHQNRNTRFGFDHDNYLGMLPHLNTWMDDGHEFFAQQRILRFLSVPLCEQTLTAEDRQNLERLAARLPELIPYQPPSLLHGDVWRENMLVGARQQPVLFDPAVYYGWPEAELSMIRQCGGVPDRFFVAYVEANPLAEGWWKRLEILYVREILSMIAHFGNQYQSLDQLRPILKKFAG